MTEQAEAKKVATQALAVVREELAELSNWTIETDEDNAFAGDMLRDVKGRHKALEEKRKTITRPINEALRAVNDLFRAPREALEQAEAMLKGKIAGFIARREAETRAALEAAAVAETPKQATEALAAIEDEAKPPEGVSIRYRYRAIVFRPDIVPDSFRMPDEAKIQEYTDEAVKLWGKPTPIPGVEFEKVPIVTSRTKP